MQPERALDGWRQWHARLGARPKILGSLSGGRSNRSFLLDSDIGKLVLRVNGRASFLPGADRGSEAAIWRTASQEGVAPPLVFADEGHRYLVSTYIEGRLPASPGSDARTLDHALSLLEACHRINVRAPVIDYASHIDHYWQLIETKARSPGPALARQRKPMQALLAELVNSNTPMGLCHHDPVIENFVGTPDRLYLIDWEYAATGLQIMDYAAFATEWRIDAKTIRARTGFDPQQLTMAKALYNYLCALWEAAN